MLYEHSNDDAIIERIIECLHVTRGRRDVFAIRWERDSRSGYMPAYDLNWDEYGIHKANGGFKH